MQILPTEQSARRDRDVFDLAAAVVRTPGISQGELRDLVTISNVCRSSLVNYLNQAIEWEWLRREGATKGTRYYPTDRFRHHVTMRDISTPASKRKIVSYNSSLLQEYVPNKTFFLPPNIRKQLHAACRPGSYNLKGETYSADVRRFMTDISFNSASFEGVNARYADTIRLLEENIQNDHLSPLDAAVLRNHYNAIRWIIENTHYPRRPMDIHVGAFDVRNIHSILSDGLLRDRKLQGCLRSEPIAIYDSAYVPPEYNDVIQREFALLMQKSNEIADPYEQAFILTVFIPYIQPFVDCNKRTSRIVCNIPLLNGGVLPISWANVNSKDYTDSLVCFYERNSLYGMVDAFSEACCRSFERFEVSQATRNPQRLEITYAKEIAKAIQSSIAGESFELPGSIEPDVSERIGRYVQETLDAILENEMVAAPYRINRQAVGEWRAKVMASMSECTEGAGPTPA